MLNESDKNLHPEVFKKHEETNMLSIKYGNLTKQLEQTEQNLIATKENHQKEMKQMHEKFEKANSR